MIHPINIEADLMASNIQRPKLFLPRQKPKITYNTEGRRFLNGQPKSPTSPQTLWNKCFLRSFAHRLASVATEELQETMSIDSFIDVVDLKPTENVQENLTSELNRKLIIDANNNSGSSDEEGDIIPATFIQGPKAASPANDVGGLNRRTSQKVNRELITPLIQSCCTDIQQNFKEFIRFDFSNAQIFNQSNSETLLTPEAHGKRIWSKGTEKPRSPLMNALCFKIGSVLSCADKIAIKLDVANPTEQAVKLEVVIHVHSCIDTQIGQILHCSATKLIELPHSCPYGSPVEFEVPLSKQMREMGGDEYLLVTIFGRVLPTK